MVGGTKNGNPSASLSPQVRIIMGNWRNRVIIGAVIAAVAVVAFAYGRAIFGGPHRADADDPELVALGKAVYASHCAECHGANLEGQPDWRRPLEDGTLPAPPHDASGHTWHHADQLLFDYTKFGGQALAPPTFQSAMPGFEDLLSDREIWAVLSFIKSRWPAHVRARQEQMNPRRG